MDDAYVVGIRLALDNGVSAGVTMIRHDLQELDKALAVSMNGLLRLQSLGDAVTRVVAVRSGPMTSQAQPHVISQTESAPVAIIAPVAPPSGVQEPPSILPPAIERTVNMVTPAIRDDRRHTPIDPTPIAVPALPFAKAPPAPARQAPEPSTSVATYAPSLFVAVSKPSPAAVIEPRPVRFDPAAETAAPSSDLIPVAPSPVLPPAAPELAQTPDRAASAPQPLASPTAAPLAPPIALPAYASTVAPAPRASAAPAAPTPTPGPTGGDVYLDGTRMGRWISDQLARDVGRPQAGTAGVDPRLSAIWPGALQGG